MTGNSVLVDTDVFIDLMRGDANIAVTLQLSGTVYITPVISAELYFGAYRSANPGKHLQALAQLTSKIRMLNIDEETAQHFVEIKLALFAKGAPIPENDIWIAASAMQHRLPLYTNDQHFDAVNGLELVSV